MWNIDNRAAWDDALEWLLDDRAMKSDAQALLHLRTGLSVRTADAWLTAIGRDFRALYESSTSPWQAVPWVAPTVNPAAERLPEGNEHD